MAKSFKSIKLKEQEKAQVHLPTQISTIKLTSVISSQPVQPSPAPAQAVVNFLNDTWVLWFHDMKNTDWTLNGYVKLFKFNTVQDFWILYNNITDLNNGSYYLMRDGYPPIWDSKENISGGAWTFKVDKRNLTKFWEELSCYCVGETICTQSSNIVGLSISPKIRNATVRVWTNNTQQTVDMFTKVSDDTKNNSIVIDFKDARFSPNSQAST